MWKKKFVSIVLISFTLILGLTLIFKHNLYSTTKKNGSLNLTYIANEGVLVASSDKKVLIDALFDNPNPAYPAPSSEILEKMYSHQPPFNSIDLVLITHNHPDHMSIIPVIQFMKKNPGTKLIAPIDAVNALQVSGSHWEIIRDRMVSLDIKINTSQEISINGINLKIFRTLHSGDLENPWNLMYMLKLGDRTVFHEGDSDGKLETFSQLRLTNTEVDLALVHFWFPLHPVGEKLIQEYLKPKHIGLIHLPLRLYEDAPGKIAMIKNNYPDIFLLKDMLEQKVVY